VRDRRPDRIQARSIAILFDEGHGRAGRHSDPADVRGVGRRRQDHLTAAVNQREDDRGESFDDTCGDEHLGAACLDVIVTLQVLDDDLPQRGPAGRFGISADQAVPAGRDRCLFDVLGGVGGRPGPGEEGDKLQVSGQPGHLMNR
jgi:hypothetical protein